jgi:four helix bundle protein
MGAVSMQDFRQLKVWQVGHQLVLAVYRTTVSFPREEKFGLTSQMRRCAVSIPANIAEGCGRDTSPDFARFLQIALGSASELEYYLLLCKDLNLLADEKFQGITESVFDVKRMLVKLIQTVRSTSPRRKPKTDN